MIAQERCWAWISKEEHGCNQVHTRETQAQTHKRTYTRWDGQFQHDSHTFAAKNMSCNSTRRKRLQRTKQHREKERLATIEATQPQLAQHVAQQRVPCGLLLAFLEHLALLHLRMINRWIDCQPSVLSCCLCVCSQFNSCPLTLGCHDVCNDKDYNAVLREEVYFTI